MAASDTVIGVVGAVLLAAVMVGVFVYEYNNAPEGDGSDVTQEARFAQEYSGINATMDLDGDGQANYLDADFDGDGIDNQNDTDVRRDYDVSGSFSLGGGPTATYLGEVDMDVQPGMQSVRATVYYNTTLPAPLPTTPAIRLVLVDANGETVGTSSAAQQTTGQTDVVVSLEVSEALEPGTYTLRVEGTSQAPSPTMTPYEGTASVYYGLGHAAEGHQHSA